MSKPAVTVGSGPAGAGRPSANRPGPKRPSLRVERSLQREGFRILAGMDEVGRGALAGPVSVGVVLIDETCRSAPAGVADSKLLPPPRRRSLVAPVRRWAFAWAVGHAGPEEIDDIGIMAALRLAGCRALEQIRAAAGVVPDLIILDGNHDWLTDPMRVGLFGAADDDTTELTCVGDGSGRGVVGSHRPGEGPDPVHRVSRTPVRTLIKADRSCSSVAAASILAKVERDDLMIALAADHPTYRWELNKGYAAPEHLAALTAHGPCAFHRRSWQLPGVPEPAGMVRAGVPPLMGDDGGADAVEVSWT